MSKYKKISRYKGIRKEIKSGRYLATKYIHGREYSKMFSSLKEAANWRNCFHPSLPEQVVANRTKEIPTRLSLKNRPKLNGEDLGYRFRDVWELFRSIHMASLETSSRWEYLSGVKFFLPLMDFKMVELTAELLDRFMEDHRKEAIRSNSWRYSFNADLKRLKIVLNWYRENYDALFVTPVLKRHKQAGFIRKPPVRNKKMSPEELIAFFNQLPPFWRDFAETQFYMGARVGEVAGLQADCVNLADKEIRIQYSVVWDKSKKFCYLKDTPKNGEVSYAAMNSRLKAIMERRLPEAANGWLFHHKGLPLGYRTIQHQYNLALKRAGLLEKYRSTHIMRHSMGTITRRVTGSFDMAQAVTRHKDIRVAQQYASLPTDANKKAVNDVFEYLSGLEKQALSNGNSDLKAS